MNKMNFLTLLLVFLLGSIVSLAQDRVTTDLSGSGWKLWKDDDSSWKQEEVFLPPVDVAKLPTHPPSGGWNVLNDNNGLNVQVPGTEEEYLQKVSGPEGDIKGVSWWYRTIIIPAASAKCKVLIRFEAARYRSEVFINHKLVGYDLIGNTPFEVDITDAVKQGETVQLAVRITDPGGNFEWRDGDNVKWGKTNVPGSHGFGGITGRVQLISCNPVYIDDIYMQNTPEYHTANAIIALNNPTNKTSKTNLSISVRDKKDPTIEVFHTELKGFIINPGQDTLSIKINAPSAKLWDVDNPNLYTCTVSLGDKNKTIDTDKKVFGFRWFELSGVDTDAMYRLNGKRIVLRTAISWGFWPENGIYATPELAEKQIRTAKALGLNMLNFHRCIGSPVILEKADEIGLLYYEEPGNYKAGIRDSFSRACQKIKLCRMVERDRSHPSMVIYSMTNEMQDVDSLMFISQKSDMRAAHQIDPSRVIVRTSGWAKAIDLDDQSKLHSRPFDTTQYMHGWYDFHRAGGPHTWHQLLYKNPTSFYGYTTNKKEIVYWGEEGALSTPSRLELIKNDIEKQAHIGWDGAMYLQEYKDFAKFINDKSLEKSFPSVDALTTAMGTISLEHQGRKIENIRTGNVSDGYAINGWESEILENHSGVVDCYRNPKADPAIMAYYNQTLYVAVKTRKQVIDLPGEVAVDFFIINEKDLKGSFTLKVNVKNPRGNIVLSKQIPVTISGGDVYGELIADSTPIPVNEQAGMYKIEAAITDATGQTVATGHDMVLGVDWKSQTIKGNGAVWEYSNVVKGFLKDNKHKEVPNYTPDAKNLDWIIVARSPKGGDMNVVPNEQFRDVTGKINGLTTSYYLGIDLDNPVAKDIDKNVELTIYPGSTPHPSVRTTSNYNIKWEGKLVPPYTGTYHFKLDIAWAADATMTIDGKKLDMDPKTKSIKMTLPLEEGKPVNISVTLLHPLSGTCRLLWSIPDPSKIDGQSLINHVKDDGTTLIIIDNAASWMELIAKNTSIKYKDKFVVGTEWLGGVAFVKEHSLFKDLPVNVGMNWPYEAVVHNGNERLGFEMEGEELVVGSYHSFPQRLGTSVGIVKCGKGKIIFSTIDIYNNLRAKESTSAVAKKILCNYLDYVGDK